MTMPETGDAGAQATAMMFVAESLAPHVEFAEGQKRMLLGRGWSEASAEQFAAEILVALTRAQLTSLTDAWLAQQKEAIG